MRALVVSSLSICFTMLLVVALLTAQSLAGVEQAQAHTIEAQHVAHTFNSHIQQTAANAACYRLIKYGASSIHSAAAIVPTQIRNSILDRYQLTMQR